MTGSTGSIAKQRLANQRLTGSAFRSPAEVVARMGAIQAQDYAGAKWAIGMRTKSATDADVERAIADGAILRTHALRPTWHFVSPRDIRWMLALTAPRVAAAMAYHNRTLGLTPALFRRSHDAIARALEGGNHLTRTELAAALKKARVSDASGQRLAQFMMQAELDAVICSGARRDKQHTYALLDERVPATKPIQRDEALAELATRYFATRSPATVQDFAWWSGLSVTDAKRAVAMAAPAPRRPVATTAAHLLPNYDEFFIAYRDRGASLTLVGDATRAQRESAVSRVIEIDGQLVGGWRRAAAGKSIVVRTTYLVPPTALQRRAVAAHAKRYGEFLGVSVEID